MLARDSRTVFVVRHTAMNAFDDAMFSFALREEIPTIRFCIGDRRYVPQERWYETIAEIGIMATAYAAPTPDWEPLMMPDGGDFILYRGLDWPDLYFHYHRTGWNWSFRYADGTPLDRPPTTSNDVNTYISTKYRRGDEEQKLFLGKVWRALRRVATNRYRSIDKEGVVTTKEAPRHPCWIGHSLLQWCRNDPRRTVEGRFRPCDDWELPADPWYRETAEKVRALYANDLTETSVQPLWDATREHPPRNPSAPVILRMQGISAIRRDASD